MRAVRSRLAANISIMLIISLSGFSCGRSAKAKPSADIGLAQARSFIVVFRPDAGAALAELADGRLDLIYGGLAPTLLSDRRDEPPASPRSGAEPITLGHARSMAYSFLLNAAPEDGTGTFNPLSIPAARRALNLYLDRESFARALPGRAAPLALPFPEDVAGAAPWYRAAYALGYRPGGRQDAADAFHAALYEAAEDPGLAGRLRRDGEAWLYDGRPLSIRVLARADDPDGALAAAAYLESALAKLGLRVELIVKDRAGCVGILAATDPSELAWQVYTERWGSGGAVAFREPVMCQMYSMAYGAYYPVGARLPEPWSPMSPEADRLVDALWDGSYDGVEAYEADAAALTAAAFDDSYRIFLAASSQSYAFSSRSFPILPPLDAEAGVNDWFWRAGLASTRGDEPLRVAVISRSPSVFVSSWDPVGLPGLRSSAALPIVEATREPGPWELCDPLSGEPAWLAARPLADEGAEDPGAIPSDALVWGGAAAGWRPAGPGLSARAFAIYDLSGYAWHAGQKSSVADALYWLAFRLDWTRDDGEGDERYSGNAAPALGVDLERIVAVKPLGGDRLAVWADWGWEGLPARRNQLCFPGLPLTHWTVLHALDSLTAGEGAPYSFDPGGEKVEPCALDPACAAAVERRLRSLAEIPGELPWLGGLVSPAEAKEAFLASADFVASRGHFWISNGPYLLASVSYDPPAFSLERHTAYARDNEAARRSLARTIGRIDTLELKPSGGGLRVEARASFEAWPPSAGGPAASPPAGAATAVVRIYGEGGGLEKNAAPAVSGAYVAAFSAAELKALGAELGVSVELRVEGGPSAFAASNYRNAR